MITKTLQGKRIKLLSMNDDPYPIEANSMGTIKSVDGIGQLQVKWDNGRTLAVIPDVDEYEIIEEDEVKEAKWNLMAQKDNNPENDEGYWENFESANEYDLNPTNGRYKGYRWVSTTSDEGYWERIK